MATEKRIVISGYYGFDNIGDEAVLLAIVKALKDYIPSVKITVLSHTPEKTKTLYHVDAINRWDLHDVRKAIKSCDLLISGGGSLLQDTTSSKTIPYYLGIVQMAKCYKKKVVFYSQGIGPVVKPWSKWLMKWICNKVDHIFVRESESKKTLESLHVTKVPITVTIDPVLGLTPNQEALQTVEAQMEKQKSVGVYIRPWKKDKQLVEALVEPVQYLIDMGYKVYGIPMYYKEDLEIIQALNEKVHHQMIIPKRELGIEETIAYTKQFDLIIGMRLHSLIMAAAVNTPMLALSYDPKVEGFMNEIGMKHCLDIKEITNDEIMEELKALESCLEEEGKRLAEHYQQKVEKAKIPAVYIKEILGGAYE